MSCSPDFLHKLCQRDNQSSGCSTRVVLHVALKTCKITRVYRRCSTVAVKSPVPMVLCSLRSFVAIQFVQIGVIRVQAACPSFPSRSSVNEFAPVPIRVDPRHPWLKPPAFFNQPSTNQLMNLRVSVISALFCGNSVFPSHARIALTTFPCTSVRRKSRPL
jgi:hypothetical protein